MKKRLLRIVPALILPCIIAVVIIRQHTQTTKDTPSPKRETTIEIIDSTLHLGTFPYKEQRKGSFHIKNTGQAPLIILNASSSCNCTEIKWDKKPVPPGDTATLEITYTPNSLGRFNKTINLYCNTKPKITTLRIDGQVTE